MNKQRIQSPAVKEPAPQLWSNCLRVGDVAYVSGMTARGPDGQTRRIYEAGYTLAVAAAAAGTEWWEGMAAFNDKRPADFRVDG